MPAISGAHRASYMLAENDKAVGPIERKRYRAAL